MLWPSQPVHFAGIVFAEIDGFGDVGFGFDPGLAGFVYQPGVELHLTTPQDAGGVEQHPDALFRRSTAPLRKVRVGTLYGAVGQLRCGLVVNADQLVGVGGIQRAQLVTGSYPLATDAQLIFAPELGVNAGQRLLHGLAVGWSREIDVRLVAKFRYGGHTFILLGGTGCGWYRVSCLERQDGELGFGVRLDAKKIDRGVVREAAYPVAGGRRA